MTEISGVPSEAPAAPIDVPTTTEVPIGSNGGNLDLGTGLASSSETPDMTAPASRGRGVVEWGKPTPKPVEAAVVAPPAPAVEIIDATTSDANTGTATESTAESTAEPVAEPAADTTAGASPEPVASVPQQPGEATSSDTGWAESPWSTPPDRIGTTEVPVDDSPGSEVPATPAETTEPTSEPAETPPAADPPAAEPRSVPSESPWSTPPETRSAPEPPPETVKPPEPAPEVPAPGPWDTPPGTELPPRSETEPVEPQRPAELPGTEADETVEENSEAILGENEERIRTEAERAAGDAMTETAETGESPTHELPAPAKAAGELATGEAVEVDDEVINGSDEVTDEDGIPDEGAEAEPLEQPDGTQPVEGSDVDEAGEGAEANETDTNPEAATEAAAETDGTGEAAGEETGDDNIEDTGEETGESTEPGSAEEETETPVDDSAEPGSNDVTEGEGTPDDPTAQQQQGPGQDLEPYHPRHAAEEDSSAPEDMHEDLRPPRPQHNRPRFEDPIPPPPPAPPPQPPQAAASPKKAPPPIQRIPDTPGFGRRLGETLRDVAIGGPGKLIDNILPHATAKKATGHEAGFWRQQVTVKFLGSTRTYFVRGPRFVAGWVGRFRALFDW